MVKKLFRYEFMAMLKAMLPFYIILGVMGLAVRLVQLFERDSTGYNIVFWSAVILLIIAVLVCLVMTVVMALVRFYKNLFGAEGYLTLSLPATPMQHLTVKVLTALGVTFITCAAAFIAGMIASFGRPFFEAVKAMAYGVHTLNAYFGLSAPFFMLEIFVYLCAYLLAIYMFLYTCLCIGQLANKHRILCALGALLGFYVLAQIFVTVLLINADAIESWAPFVWWDNLFCTLNPPALPLHLLFCAAALWQALLLAVFTAVSHRILSRRLNLE